MIKAIIFDFGDIFINLDKKGAINRTKIAFGDDIITEKPNTKNKDIFKVNDAYEKGELSSSQFIAFYKTLNKNLTNNDVAKLWNSLIKDFPKYRLEFIKQLAKEKKYKLILLSNTNALHIEQVIDNMTLERYNDFKSCFDKFYLSHEIHFRKPNKDIFEFVLHENHLKAKDCLFVDDTIDNTNTAAKMGIHTWHLIPGKDDVVNLFKTKKDLF